ncbi:MAG TPA: hypothetical protein DDZ89_05635, partial [Clostridiales bacterium]|nr:hypothetical protein [Clostridiales bacterium]
MSTKIQTLERIRQLFIKDPATILFTGDSVSYNRFDFDPVPRTNGYDCYPGMQSWSFLLRDLFIQNTKGYLHGDIIAAKHSEIEGDGAIYCGYKKAYVFPQYGRVLGFTAKSPDDKLIVKYKADSHGKIALYMLSNPLKTSCRFDLHVNGKHSLSVSNSGENKLYQGFEPFIVELAGPPNQENKISFENIIPDTQDQSLSEIFLVGISSETVHVHMTGQGSTTCKWLDDNCEERILRYKPDLVFISLAGNDIILSDPETFERALRSVIQKGRSINPH